MNRFTAVRLATHAGLKVTEDVCERCLTGARLRTFCVGRVMVRYVGRGYWALEVDGCGIPGALLRRGDAIAAAVQLHAKAFEGMFRRISDTTQLEV